MVAPSDFPNEFPSRSVASAMHPFRLHTHLRTTSETPTPPACRERAAKNGKKPRVNVFGHSEGFTDVISNLRNRVSYKQLELLLVLGVRKSSVADLRLRCLHGWDMSVDLCTVRFSDRFSATWVYHRDAVVWFCVVDGEFMVFSLKHGDCLSIAHPDKKRPFPELRIPHHGILWTKLQQLLVENFEDDETVRAISAAVMICCTPAGEFNGVARQLLPSKLQTLSRKVIYDSPIDEDIVTVLANPYEYDGRLFFKSGGGYVAESSTNESMAVLRRTENPCKLRVFEERHDLLMPFLFR